MKKFKRYFRLMNLLFDANWQHSSPEKNEKNLNATCRSSYCCR